MIQSLLRYLLLLRLDNICGVRKGSIFCVEKTENGWLVFRTRKGKKFGVIQLNPEYEGTIFEVV